MRRPSPLPLSPLRREREYKAAMRPGALLFAVLLLAGCEVTSSSAPPQSRSTHDLLWNDAKNRPHVFGGKLFTGQGDAERTARDFLASRAAEFHLDRPGSSLTLSTTREGLAGRYLRFAQQQLVGAQTLPVFEGEVIVLVRDDGTSREVRAVNLELKDEAFTVVEAGDLGAAAAIASALRAVQAVAPFESEPAATRGVHVSTSGTARIAWRVKVATETPPHDWTVYVDAATGAELGRRDGVRSVNGTAYVFDMNPVASTGDLALIDGNNANTPALEAARFLVTLPRLDGSGNLSGSFANARPRTVARAFSATNEFFFTRDQLGFEQANVYFHLDRAQAHIQALGFMNVNNRVQEAVVDIQSSDNSYYSSNNLRVNFGLGGVDDAEDGDIVLHEYGHSIQDNQVPNFGGTDEGAMGEGFGDYLAAAFSLSLALDAGHPQLSDPACVGDWDGTFYSTDTPKCLRRVDVRKHYPESEAGEVHDDGEMWSAALWDLRGRLGADAMDRLVFEHHFLLAGNGTFFNASQALVIADQNLNGGANGQLIRRRMIHYGLSRTLSMPAPMGPTTSLPISIGPTRDTAGNYLSNRDETKTVAVPGATGLILHFSRIDLETHNSCFQMGCDNLYLTNADGDLFQVLSGTQLNVSSVAIPGDTVNIRLVTDPSQVRFGFNVDRVDVLGAADAGLVFDGGMDTFDAGVDAGRPDAGSPPPPQDAGSGDAGNDPIIDAGGPVPLPDAGRPANDAGMMPPDAGPVLVTKTLEAYGTEALTPALQRGCGCGAATGMEAWLALALLGLIRRRRS